MRSFKWLGLLFCISTRVFAFDMERDTWLLPESSPRAAEARQRFDPIEFARVNATGNDRVPVYAEGEQEKLISAAARNDIKQLEALLKKNVNPNAVANPWGENALMHAVLHGNVEMTRLLLEVGANPNRKGRGFTPLGMASLLGHTQVVRLLLKAGADIDSKSDDGNTPIIAATIMNRLAVVQALLSRHADTTIWNREGRTSLSIAAQQGNTDIVALLLKAGVDPNVKDRNGNRPLQWSGDHHAIASMLVAHGGISF